MIPAVPKYGFYFDFADVETARKNIERLDWAGKRYKELKAQCDKFIEYTDEFIYRCILSMKDQVFAYGTAGCPNCKKPFPMNLEEQRGLVSDISRFPEKKVTCPHCRMEFPNSAFPDDGKGFELDGKGFYMVGIWNFYQAGELLGGVRDHEGMVTKLTYMYMLTGSRDYAKKALVILDAFSAIYPGTIGPRDFTPFGSTLDLGRLHLLTSIVYRIKICLASDYDWLYGSAELDMASPALKLLGKSGTMRDNIEAMLKEYMLNEPNGPIYDLTGGNLTQLQNHEADCVRAMLGVGIVLDNLDYCKWGINAVEAFVYNTIGRDGMYYEGSFGYSFFTIAVFLDISLLAMRSGIINRMDADNFFNSERLYMYSVENPLEILCQGRIPCYGDWGMDAAISTNADTKLLCEVYRAALFFHKFSTDNVIKERAKKRLSQLYNVVTCRLGTRGVDLFFPHEARQAEETFKLPVNDTIMGQGGIAILRAKSGDTVLVKFGQNNTHSHDDALAYNYYSDGVEISGDIGYGVYGTNAHYGWSTKAIAHNTVVVNEDETMVRRQIYKPFSGGDISFYHRSGNISAIECRAPHLYGVNAYQRMLALVDIDDSASYIVDFFHISGARVLDYAYHAFNHPSILTVDCAGGKNASSWTLAGVDHEEENLYFNAPGKSYGERLTAGETFSTLLGDEKPQLWSPDRNNGYGYIYGLKEYGGENRIVTASWKSENGLSLKLHVLAEDKDRLFTGMCPSLEGTLKYPVFIIRNYKPDKTFASVVYTAKPEGVQAVKAVKRLNVENSDVVALCVELHNGCQDYWFYSPHNVQTVVSTAIGKWIVEGRCGWIRVSKDKSIIGCDCVCASSMSIGNVYLLGRNEKWCNIHKVDIQGRILYVESRRPGYKPAFARVRSDAGKRSHIYPVEDVREWGSLLMVKLRDSVILSKGIAGECGRDEMECLYPLPLGASSPSPFEGKTAIGAEGGLAIIESVPDIKSLKVCFVKPFRYGEKFDIVDVVEGDKLQFI